MTVKMTFVTFDFLTDRYLGARPVTAVYAATMKPLMKYLGESIRLHPRRRSAAARAARGVSRRTAPNDRRLPRVGIGQPR